METEHSAPEQRTVDVDVKDIDTRGRTLHGYAAVYDTESADLGGFRERIAPGAFSGVLDADVRALLNHDPSQVLGRTKSGTLRLHDEQRGLRFRSTCRTARSGRTCARPSGARASTAPRSASRSTATRGRTTCARSSPSRNSKT